MSELISIEAYLKFDPTKFEKVLERIKIVLMRIDLWNDEVKAAFELLILDAKENGYEYLSADATRYYKSKVADFPIRPIVFTFVSTAAKSEPEFWLCMELLMEREKMLGADAKSYKNNDQILQIMRETLKEFSTAGVYLTREKDHGKTFDAMESNDDAFLWSFERALIPVSLKEKFSKAPAGFTLIEKEDYIQISAQI